MLLPPAARLPPAHHPPHLSLPHRHPPRRLSSPQLKPRLCLSTSCFAQHLQVDLPITPVKSNDLKVHATGDGGLEELQEEFSDGRYVAISLCPCSSCEACLPHAGRVRPCQEPQCRSRYLITCRIHSKSL